MYGLIVSALSKVAPWKNSTLEIVPSESEALADNVRVAGAVVVKLFEGEVREMVGERLDGAARSKMAEAVVFAERVIEQEPVPEQPPPLQPAKVEPLAGEAARVTLVPPLNDSLQSEPQVMPVPLITPPPVPPLAIVKV